MSDAQQTPPTARPEPQAESTGKPAEPEARRLAIDDVEARDGADVKGGGIETSVVDYGGLLGTRATSSGN